MQKKKFGHILNQQYRMGWKSSSCVMQFSHQCEEKYCVSSNIIGGVWDLDQFQYYYLWENSTVLTIRISKHSVSKESTA